MDDPFSDPGWTQDPDDGFIGHVGGLWRRDRDGGPEFAFVARSIHANRNGVVHGGMLMTFVDRAFGHTARWTSGAMRGATISLNYQFLDPVRIGDMVRIAPQVMRSTGQTVFLMGCAVVEDVPVVTAQGVFRVARAPTAADGQASRTTNPSAATTP